MWKLTFMCKINGETLKHDELLMEIPKDSISLQVYEGGNWEERKETLYLSRQQLSLAEAQGVFGTCQLVLSVAPEVSGINPGSPSGAETDLGALGQSQAPLLSSLTLSG